MSGNEPATPPPAADGTEIITKGVHALAVPHTLMSDGVPANLWKSSALFLFGAIGISFARNSNISVSGDGPVSTGFVWFLAFCVLALSAVVAFRHRDFARVELDLFRLASLLMTGLIICTFFFGALSLVTVPSNWLAFWGLGWVSELLAFAVVSAATFGLIAWWTRSREPKAWAAVHNKGRWFVFYCAVNVLLLYFVTHGAIGVPSL
jgi:hypothetical protein